jgi:hypothetical protein
MAFYYNITEFNTALKPFLLEKLLDKGYDGVVYLDPDIEVYGSMKELQDILYEYDIVLTPHVCKPYPDDRRIPSLESIIRAGQFNLGFIGISKKRESIELLKWWQTVCVDRCILDPEHKYFVDQFWADIFPSFVHKTFILRDPAYNMAYWNVSQRSLRAINNRWLTDTGELKFFHFSGLCDDDVTKVSIHQDRLVAPVGSPLHKMLSDYIIKVKSNQWSAFDNYQYSFQRYTNDIVIADKDRKRIRSLSKEERKKSGNFFDQCAKVKAVKTKTFNWKVIFQDLMSKAQLIRKRICTMRDEYIRTCKQYGRCRALYHIAINLTRILIKER